jgi:anti-sigma B factor antagonist
VNELARVESERRGPLLIVRVEGEVDMSNASKVFADMEALVPHDVGELAVDLSATTYLDSAGVSMLLRLTERLQARRQPLRVVTPPGSAVRAVLELAGLRRVMRLEDA